MQSRCLPTVLVAGLVPVLSLVAASPMSGAAPGGAYNVASIPAGVTEGAELAIDPGRRSVFIADGDDYNQKDDTVGAVVPYPHQLRPKVAVVNLDSRRVKRTIDYAPLPNGRTTMGPLTVPMPQVPVGLAVDPARGRVLTTSARAGGAAIVDMGATRARPSDMIRTSIPLKHVMGVAADPVSGRAYIANSNADAVMVVDTATRGELAVIRGVYRPSLLSVDPARGRVYAASFATGEIAVIDPDTLTVAKRIRTGTTPVNVAIDAQRRLAYTANLFKRSITVIDLDSDRVVATVPTARRPHTVAVDPRTGLVLATEFQSPNLTVLTAKSATRGRG